ncbi:hypothetical protein BEH94_06685 [Candidatus Altiarchaeales archaeon WOR_SM1_SCG]|nr:hypothetical protein BEH94_06685 [Candidatus Altiarchaeales archaeon WOR_SM1_SCG]
MKILQMARWFFPHQGGGTIRTYQTAKNLVKLGNEVHLLVHHPKSTPHVTLEEEVKKYEEVDGIHVYRLPYIGPNYLYYSIVIPLMAFYAIRIIMKNKIDVILSHNPPYLVGMASWIASRVTGVPMIINVHDLWGASHYSKFELKFGLVLEKFCCKRAKKIIIASKENIDILFERVKISKEGITVIPNSVDTDEFKPMSKDLRIMNKYDIPSNKPIIFFVGNLAPWIGIKYLIEAVPYILKKHIVHVVVVGGGIELPKLKTRSKELKIDKNITFTGVVPYNTLPKLMNLADVCVSTFPNRSAGMSPHNCKEYMACGKAVVATDAIGFREFVIDGETGILVLPEDPAAMADGVIKLLENDELRTELGINARKFVEKHFNWEKNIGILDKLLKGELNSKRRCFS